jgi:hypothetical protein
VSATRATCSGRSPELRAARGSRLRIAATALVASILAATPAASASAAPTGPDVRAAHSLVHDVPTHGPALRGAPPVSCRLPVAGRLEAGPALTGVRTAWVERHSRDSVAVRLGCPSPRPRTLASLSTAGRHDAGRSGRVSALAASASAVAIELNFTGDEDITPDYLLRAGMIGNRLRDVSGCGPSAPRLDGTRLVQFDPLFNCSKGLLEGGGIVMWDLSRFAISWTNEGPGLQPPLALSGSWLAFRDADSNAIVIQEVSTGEVAYRIPTTAGERIGLDLQPNGTAAVARAGKGGPASLEWYSLLEPFAHRLPLAARAPLVRLASDRLLFEQQRPHGRTALVTAGLDGATQPLARFGPRRRRVGAFDFDGRRATFAARGTRGRTQITIQIAPER